MKPFVLESARLRLDSLQASDSARVHQYCQDPQFERFLTIPWPYRPHDADFYINEHVPRGWTGGSELTWALRATGGDFLGVLCLRLPRGDVGYWLGAEHRGNGFMPEALSALADWVFTTRFAELEQLSWEAMTGNFASMAVARKAGFTYTGTAPARLPVRDGSHPPAWNGVLRAGDDRSVKPGWPDPPKTQE
ncbi:MAG: hypothetical protein JWP30_520 [Homoserinimonas sp.]|nr:hypothetical protein [Homoserinimonas sp.]